MRKNLFLILVFVLVLTLILPLGVWANEGVEKYIPAIKQIFEIGDEYGEFNLYTRDYRGKITSDLSWRSMDDNKSISVEIDQDGNILGYNKYISRDREEHGRFPKVTKEEAMENAKRMIARIDPSLLDKLEYEDMGIMGNINTYYLRFVRKENNIAFNYNSISVNVNSYTGEVENLHMDWDKDLKLPGKENIIDEEKAYDLYREGQDADLLYRLENKEGRIEGSYLYTLKDRDRTIDAKSGKVIEDLHGINPYLYYGSLFGRREAVSLEEKNRLLGSKEVVSREEAERNLRKFADLDDSYTTPGSQLMKNELDGSYIWEIEIHKQEGNSGYGTTVSVDAKSNEVLDFHKFAREEEEVAKYGEAESLKKVEEFLEKKMADKYKEVEYTGSMFYDYDGNIREYYFTFTRLLDGVKVPQNGFSISISSATGEIMNYNYNWTDISLPSKEGIIGKEEAKEILLKDGKVELNYIIDKESVGSKDKKVRLVYNLGKEESPFLDAKSAKKVGQEDFIGMNGMDEREKDYKDIGESYAKDQIKKLKEAGIYLPGEEFLPKKDILQKDFLYLLSNSKGYFSPYDDQYLYERFAREGVVKTGEKNPEATITRGEAIRFVVRSFGQEEAAKLGDIYKSNYKDMETIPKDLRGYVAIAEGLGLISGEGNFRANDNLTREEAAMIIFNILDR